MTSDEKDAGRPASVCNCLAVRQAARQITQLYDAELAEVGLRTTQYSVLAFLDRLGPSSLSDLAEELVLDRSTLGHNLRPLEREGFVRLATDRTDRRTRRLELTAAGKVRLEEARPYWQKAQRRFESSFGKADARELRDILRRAVESAAS
ncbi:MAG: MarR family winged helix-turn-helix transcriptional regulator [bacterium]